MSISRRLAFGVLCLLAFATASACAQTLTASAQPPTPADSVTTASVTSAKPPEPANPVGLWNFSVNDSAQHDSSTGWSDFLTPGLSLHPVRHLAFDANFPWYLSLAAYVPTTVNGVTSSSLTQVRNVIGDATASAHVDGKHGDLSINAGAAVGFPTGDKSLGVGAGTTTYHFGTHAEYSVGPFTPDVEAGIGNSSAFANHVVKKAYTAVGEIANFQAGMNIDLPRKLSLDVELYEAMPMQLANIFGTISRRGNHNHGGGKKTAQGATGSSEDNGATAELDVPLTRHLAFSASYDRSFIQADDIVGFSISWVLHAPRTESSAPVSPMSRR
ncbi:MAG TPA: hypothetical protein VKB47_12395 [Terracidiphilus sp.]|nr:hypothetical protein [Terracidiphilus sp.]